MTSEPIHPATRIGRVDLLASDPARLTDFYAALGFQVLSPRGERVSLGAGGEELLVLEAARAPAPPRPSAGLYHFAVLLPSRADLALVLARLIDASTPLEGFADHLVSEAVYLSDPEGNGIELYRDRPRTEWYGQDGRLRMGTEPLDVDGLLAEARKEHGPDGTAAAGLPPGTRIGHVHLQVADIAASERFYTGVLGFTLMTRFGPAAGFVSAGGYHHHIGYNTWAGRGLPPPIPETPGLKRFTVELPDRETLEAVQLRAAEGGAAWQREESRLLIRDPSGIPIALAAREPPSAPSGRTP